MVLLGLGIITVSFAFLLYKYPPKWKAGHGFNGSPASGEKPPVQGAQDEHEQDTGPAAPQQVAKQRSLKHAESGSDGLIEDLQSRTPKAGAQTIHADPAIPHFSLDAADTGGSLSTPEIQAPDSQRPSANLGRQDGIAKLSPSMPPPTLPLKYSRQPAAKPSATTLMPPPPVKPSALRPLPKLNGSLNPPPSSAAALRGPPSLRPGDTDAGLAASTSTLPPSFRPPRKVVLEPGYSPLDWAQLTAKPPTPSFLRGASVPGHLVRVKPSQLKEQHGRKGRDAWGTYQGKVYNLTPYLKFHPGGVGELMRGAGKVGEAERLFMEVHPWINWDGILGECLVGIMDGESEGMEVNGLDDMD